MAKGLWSPKSPGGVAFGRRLGAASGHSVGGWGLQLGRYLGRKYLCSGAAWDERSTLIFRALSTTFLIIAGVGVFLRNADNDVIVVLAWVMVAAGALGQLFFGLIYFFFFRES
jgi:hypothetical protein